MFCLDYVKRIHFLVAPERCGSDLTEHYAYLCAPHACVACAIIADRLGLAAGVSTATALGFLTHSRPIPPL